MNLYRLHPKSSTHRAPAPQDLPDAAPASPADAQPAEQADPLGNAEFAGLMKTPKGSYGFRLFMAAHWRYFLFGIGAGGMLLLFADRFALVLSALSQILRPSGFPTVQ